MLDKREDCCLSFVVSSLLKNHSGIGNEERRAFMAQKIGMSHAEVFQPASPYTLGIKSIGGSTVLYISGQVALDARGQLVGKNDIEAQTRQVFRNIINLLASEEASIKNVVKMTTFLTDRSNLEGFMSARKEFLKEEDIYPASTAVIVEGLADRDWLLEIEATAVV
jgi:enamine deaminase RidA (YjgF/YER057c/UK114 family)